MATEMEGVEHLQSDESKITHCEVCASNEAKYTCPRCEVRTCCLQCTNIHKKELDCNGVRDRVKFKRLKDFDNIDLLNDYRLLEETARIVSKPVQLPPTSCFNERLGGLPLELYRLKCAAGKRGVHLHFLPPSFSRHRNNTTRLDHRSQVLGWRVDWVFPQADHIILTDDCVPDSTLVSACLHKWLDPEWAGADPALAFYQSAGHTGIKMLLRADRTIANRYFLLDPTTTLRENLSGKSIIEYPVILVILSHHIDMYYVLSSEEEDELYKRQRRRIQARNRPKNQPDNFFPSSIKEEKPDEVEEEGRPAPPEFCGQPDYSHHENDFQQRGRGMGRGWGMGRGRGRGRMWNGRARGMERGRGSFQLRREDWQSNRPQRDFHTENFNTNHSDGFSLMNNQPSAHNYNTQCQW